MIITLAGQKGGVGKSTIACSILAALSESGMTAALADDDRQQACFNWYAKRSTPTVHMNTSVSRNVAETLLDLREKHGNVVCDLPGTDDDRTEQAIAVSDIVILPIAGTQNDLNTLIHMRGVIDHIKRHDLHPDVRVLLNRIPHNRPRVRRDAQEFVALSDFPRYKAHLCQRTAYEDSMSSGMGVTELGWKHDKAVAEFLFFFEELIDQMTSIKHKNNVEKV